MALTRININFIEDQIRAGALLPWEADVGYVEVPSFAVGSDGIVYRSTVANGVDSDGVDIGPGAVDPVTDTSGTWEEFATTGATGGGRNRVFYENDQIVTDDYTITSGRNAMSAGPVQIGTDIELSQVSSDGVELLIITTEAHGMIVGDTFSISGTTAYNGTYTVNTVPNTTRITALSTINTGAETSGQVSKEVIVTVPDGSTWTVV